MTRTFSDGHPKVLPACNFLSQYYFYNIFLQKSCRFSLQTGSGVGFLRLTTVWGQTRQVRFSRWRGVHSLEVWVLVGNVKRDKQNGACWALIDKEEVLRIYCELVHQQCLKKTLSVVSDKKNNMSTPAVQDRNDSTKGVNGKRES